MNVMDRIIGSVSPKRALDRAVARKRLEILGTGYSNHGASRGKNWDKGWNWAGGSAQEDIELNLSVMRQRSRDLFAGGGFARGALTTMRTSIVGAGMTVRPQADADLLGMTRDEASAWQRAVAREFDLWARSVNCDADRQNNFYELQQLAQLSWLMSGDVFALPMYARRPGSPYELCVRLIEADRVCTPGQLEDSGLAIPTGDGGRIFSGVEVNAGGEVAAYHIASRHPLSFAQGATDPLEWVRVTAFGARSGRANILHLMEHERPEQRRGNPFLAPVMEELKQMARYVHAEQMNAVVNSMFTVFIKPNGTSGELGEGIAPGDRISESAYDYEMGSGNIIDLREGEEPYFANPNHTNQAFDAFISSLCMSIGSALEIPYEILLKRFNSSYTASRASSNEFWRVIRMRRRWLIEDFCQPVYEEFMAEAVARGRIGAPGFFEDPAVMAAYCNAEWNGPAPGHLNPQQEIAAAIERVRGGYSTRQKETAELNGGDWWENIRQCADEENEVARLIGAGSDVNAGGGTGNGVPVENPDEREEQRGTAAVR